MFYNSCWFENGFRELYRVFESKFDSKAFLGVSAGLGVYIVVPRDFKEALGRLKEFQLQWV